MLFIFVKCNEIKFYKPFTSEWYNIWNDNDESKKSATARKSPPMIYTQHSLNTLILFIYSTPFFFGAVDFCFQ